MSDVATTAKPAAPTRAQAGPLNQVKNLRELFEHPDFQQRIHDSLPKGQNQSRMLRTFIMAVQKVPKLAQVNPMQMMGIFTAIAALGLEPNTPLGQCYILPFDKRGFNKETRRWEVTGTDAQLIIGYPGYIDLIYRGDKVKDIDCQVVWEGDEFSYEHGTNKHLRHVAKGKPQKPGAEPLYVYMHARMANGGEQFEVMTAADVHRIRARSQGFQTAMRALEQAQKDSKSPSKAYTEAPWIKDPIPMWRKTALRAGQKWLPKTVELAAAMALDGDDNERVDYGKVIDAESVTSGAWEPEEDETQTAAEPEPQQQTDQRQIGQDAPAMTAATLDPRVDKVTLTNQGPATVVHQGTTLEPGQTTTHTIAAPVLYLVSEDGEMIDGGTHRDPVTYARALQNLWLATAPEFKDAILENNDEYIAIAVQHPGAAKIIRDIQDSAARQRSQPGASTWQVPVPTRGKDQQDLKGYVANLEISMRDVGSADDLNAWRMANEPTYKGMPKGTRAAIDALLYTTRDRLGLGQPTPKEKPADPAQNPENDQRHQDGQESVGGPAAGDPRPEPPPPGEAALAPPTEDAATMAGAADETALPEPAQQQDPDLVRFADFQEQIAKLNTDFECRHFDLNAAWRAVNSRWKNDRPELHERAFELLRLRHKAVTERKE